MNLRWIKQALALVLLSAGGAAHSTERLLQPSPPTSRQ